MKKGPILVISFLTALSSLIIGIQYGKFLRQDEKTTYVKDSTSPEQKKYISPSPELIIFTKFTNKKCGFTIAIPDKFKPEQETSISATLKHESQKIYFTCAADIKIPEKEKIATDELNINNKDINTYTIDNITSTVITHPYTGAQILFSASQELIPLIENSLKFTEQ